MFLGLLASGVLTALSSLFGEADIPPRFFSVRPFYNSGVLVDTVGVLVFSGDKSYTGEDSFEVHAHGGLGVMSLITEALDSCGFEEAPPGEFTKRAFLNNKISLNEAESVLDVIDSAALMTSIFRLGLCLESSLKKFVFCFCNK